MTRDEYRSIELELLADTVDHYTKRGRFLVQRIQAQLRYSDTNIEQANKAAKAVVRKELVATNWQYVKDRIDNVIFYLNEAVRMGAIPITGRIAGDAIEARITDIISVNLVDMTKIWTELRVDILGVEPYTMLRAVEEATRKTTTLSSYIDVAFDLLGADFRVLKPEFSYNNDSN